MTTLEPITTIFNALRLNTYFSTLLENAKHFGKVITQIYTPISSV